MDKPLIVIVDGHEERAAELEDVLHGDFDCYQVGTVDEALAAIRGNQPTAVVIDFPFPTEDRRCLSRVLTDDPATGDIPLVAYSSWDFAKTREKARALGCSAFVARAAGPAGVIDAIAELMGKESRSAA